MANQVRSSTGIDPKPINDPQAALSSTNQDLQDQISCLNRVLHRFSDISYSTRPQQKELWKQGNTPKLSEITQAYAPIHLQKQFEELYRKLHPCLVQRDGKTNASAFLQGSRGSGKSLLLNQCIQAFQDELMASNKQVFRKVQLNGIVTPGDQVSLVVREILRQLSTEAYHETKSSTTSVIHSAPDNNKRAKTNTDRFEELLRLKRTSFTNNIQLLNEILKLACIDGVPILIVLEELDAFIGSTPSTSVQGETSIENVGKDRQVLLYHLLDRVATQGSFVSLVGLTCHYGTIGMLEKRIRSRAEGTSCFLQFGPCSSIASLKDIVLSKFDDDNDDTAKALCKQVTELLSKPTNDTDPEHRRVYEVLDRDQRLGKDIRWFSRVFTIALSLFRQDCVSQLGRTTKGTNVTLPRFHAKYLKEALVDMGGSFLTDSGERDLVIVDGMAVDPRIQALLDLSGPQVALVLASRRILARDSHRENYTMSLTLDRILEEYKFYPGNSNRYNKHVLYKSFQDLLELNVFRAASDHTGAAPLQFNHDISVYSMDPNIVGRMPLHLTVDIHRELRKVIEKNLLNCSTALREWGRKIN